MSDAPIQNRPICQNPFGIRTLFHSIGELDQLRELARGASLDIVQLKPGRMKGVIAHADLGLSSVHMNCMNLPARGRGSLSTDRFTFVVFPAQIEGRFNSHSLDSGRIVVYPPGAEFEGTIEGSFQDWVFTVGIEELTRVYEILSLRDRPNLSGSVESRRPNPQALQRLRAFAQDVISLTEQCPLSLADDQIRRWLHLQMMDSLSLALRSTESESRSRRGKQSSHWRIVREAEDFIEQHSDLPISLADLCSVTAVSERTLRRAFLDVIEVSPNAYLKAVRLKRVHAELERSTPAKTSVTSAAMRGGFFHLGHFSRDYKRFFGEAPSSTLQRSDGTSDERPAWHDQEE